MRSMLSSGVVMCLVSPALAGPGLTLEKGTVNAALTFENNASAGHFGEEASFAPDLHVGVTDDLTVSVVHSSYARTGSRGGYGDGLCAGKGCENAYDNGGVEAAYGASSGPLAFAVASGLHATSFAGEDFAAKVGARLRYKLDRWTFLTQPTALIAISNRDHAYDKVWLPVSASYAITKMFGVGVGSTAKTALDHMGSKLEVGASVSATVKPAPDLVFGAGCSFGRLAGGETAMAEDHGFDVRTMQVWMSVTR